MGNQMGYLIIPGVDSADISMAESAFFESYKWGIISICPENMLTTKVRNKEGIMNKIEINSGGDLLVLGGVQAPYDKLRSRYSV